jgi:flagellar hook-length control protein FliK
VAQTYGRVAEQSRQVPVEAPAAQPNGTPAASPSTPVVGTQHAAGAAGPGRATPVPLARAAENVEHVLRLAASRGVTHARIALNPAELGSIDVHMRHTAEGLVATVVAHAAESVQQLQNAAGDLRRSLEQQGLNLLSLDIAHSGDERSAGRAGTDGDGPGGRGGSGDSVAGDAAAAEGEATVKTNLQLPNGVLVDVLA